MEQLVIDAFEYITSHTVHSKDIEGAGAVHDRKTSHNFDDGAVLFRPKQAFRLTRNAFKKLISIEFNKKNLFNVLTD